MILSWIDVRVLLFGVWDGHVLLTLPFLGQEGFDLVMATQEGVAVAPDGRGCVGEGYAGWVSVTNISVSASCLEGLWSWRRWLMKDGWFVLGIPQSLRCFDFLVGRL